ncbi:MAG TPA: flagellin, partial [Archaeoglobus profundus]|nr:flagellin [Archaeoglobus profundus]
MKWLINRKGFTGLEAAITLIAFITVAAVFSYILLGAGFFATQKGQEVVHTGVRQVSSSFEIIGTIVGYGNTTGNNLNATTFTIQLAAGGQPIDLSKTIITVTAPKYGW